MKLVFSATLGLLLFAAIASLAAKGATSKIIISGESLATPIEMTSATTVRPFQVWAGAGTTTCVRGVCREHTTGFIIDWPSGVVAERPRGLPQYTVWFYTDFDGSGLVEPSGEIVREKAIYVVLYEIDPATGKGFVYLPGGKDDWAAVNTGTIYRGVEENWFHATSEWDSVAGPLITRR